MRKIGDAIMISKAPRFAKVFDDEGVLATSLTPNDESWDQVTRSEIKPEEKEEEEKKEIWTACLNPIFNMIRIADTADGEVPNVSVVFDEGVKCYAVSSSPQLQSGSNGEEERTIAIRAGERILRAPDRELRFYGRLAVARDYQSGNTDADVGGGGGGGDDGGAEGKEGEEKGESTMSLDEMSEAVAALGAGGEGMIEGEKEEEGGEEAMDLD